MWVLRDAVEEAGHGSSGRPAADYYRSLARDVNSACREGRLECGPERASMMPPFRTEYVRPLVKALLHGARYLVGFQDFDPNAPESLGDADRLELFRHLTRERLFPATSGTHYTGWVVSPSSPVRLTVWTSEEFPADAIVKHMPSPDVWQVLKARGIDTIYAQECRFEITARDCGPGCFLQIETYDGQPIKRINLNGRMPSLNGPELYFYLERSTAAEILPEQEQLDRFKIRVLSFIGKAYQILVPVLSILALAVYALTAIQVFRKRKNMGIVLINTALLLTIMARVFLLGLIEVTSFPAITVLYFSAAYPLLLLFTPLAAIDLWERSQLRRDGGCEDQSTDLASI